MKTYLPIQFDQGVLKLLDQRYLPATEILTENRTLEDGRNAIKDMVVRGAPCIGFTAIYTMALWANENPSATLIEFDKAADYLASARPTAVNLAFELQNCKRIARDCNETGRNLYQALVDFGDTQIQKSESNNLNMAKLIAQDIQQRNPKKLYRILTHCNTGFLACGSIGTALGVIEHMHSIGMVENVWVDETRPYLQGARLTAYELNKLGVEHKLVVEGCASHLMKNGLVDFVVVGADRIVSNGDTANKIGTSNLSVLAHYYKIPFYVVAPTSSFDLSMQTGDEIEIELRPEEEITNYGTTRIAPVGTAAFNPSFDVTEGKLITAISCERGIIYPPYQSNISKVLQQ